VVPSTFAEICDWAYVSKISDAVDHTRLYQVLYNTAGSAVNTVYPVVLRLQGFLGRFEVSPLGTWNG
jgi:hypothetical protein